MQEALNKCSWNEETVAVHLDSHRRTSRPAGGTPSAPEHLPAQAGGLGPGLLMESQPVIPGVPVASGEETGGGSKEPPTSLPVLSYTQETPCAPACRCGVCGEQDGPRWFCQHPQAATGTSGTQGVPERSVRLSRPPRTQVEPHRPFHGRARRIRSRRSAWVDARAAPGDPPAVDGTLRARAPLLGPASQTRRSPDAETACGSKPRASAPAAEPRAPSAPTYRPQGRVVQERCDLRIPGRGLPSRSPPPARLSGSEGSAAERGGRAGAAATGAPGSGYAPEAASAAQRPLAAPRGLHAPQEERGSGQAGGGGGEGRELSARGVLKWPGPGSPGPGAGCRPL
ncbi:collagen alpha-1(I) chain-like [Choloepus didactylus]|uniref:collagen alpha-1(I) chain-like n=1 Tax=Choloepus didactylus TaxID=27675 RepID=UPI00189EF8D9|nr:collagen alpha-1(I) chain-like [Choloepus didactylus]